MIIKTRLWTNLHVHVYIYAVSEIDRLASQHATPNCLGCYLKLNLESKVHTEIAAYLSHKKLRTPYTLNNILWNKCYLFATNCDPLHDLNSNFYAKTATQLYKIISDINMHKSTSPELV